MGITFILMIVATFTCFINLSCSEETTSESVADAKRRVAPSMRINTRASEDGTGNMFEATEEWQVVQPGQVLPPGLHVEHNLQTGITRAKLHSPTEQSSADQALSLTTTTNDADTKSDANSDNEVQGEEPKKQQGPKIRFAEDDELWKRVVREQRAKDNLERAFREFERNQQQTGNGQADPVNADSSASEDEEAFPFPFRTVDEIKEELNISGSMAIRTDAELLVKLTGEYANATDEQRVAILRDFELLLHSHDNAVVFTDLGGIELLFGELAARNGSTKEQTALDVEVLEHALHALGAALQSNEYVQLAAIRNGACDVLVALLTAEFSRSSSSSSRSAATATANEQRQQFESVRLSRLLFSVAALLRNSNEAQQRFAELGGFSLLTQVFNVAVSNGATRMSKKITALLKDLLVERDDYFNVLVDLGWCSLPIRALNRLLTEEERGGEASTLDNDAVEKQLELVRLMIKSEDCLEQLAHETRSATTLRRLERTYQQLTANEEDGDVRSYLHSLLQTVTSLFNTVHSTRRVSVDEL